MQNFTNEFDDEFESCFTVSERLASNVEMASAVFSVLTYMLRNLEGHGSPVPPTVLVTLSSQYAKLSVAGIKPSNLKMSYVEAVEILSRKVQKIPTIPDWHTLACELISQHAGFAGHTDSSVTFLHNDVPFSFNFTNGPFDVSVKKGGVEIISPLLSQTDENAASKLLAFAHSYTCDGSGKFIDVKIPEVGLIIKNSAGASTTVKASFALSDSSVEFMKSIHDDSTKTPFDAFRKYVEVSVQKNFVPNWVFLRNGQIHKVEGRPSYKSWSQVVEFITLIKSFDPSNIMPLCKLLQSLRKSTVVDMFCAKNIDPYFMVHGKDITLNESVVNKLGKSVYDSITSESVVAVVGVDSKKPNLQVRAIKTKCESVGAKVYYFDLNNYVDVFGLAINVQVADITKPEGIKLIANCKPTLIIMDTAVEEPERTLNDIDRLNTANIKAANELSDYGIAVVVKAFLLGNIDSTYEFTITGTGRAHSGEVFIRFGNKNRTRWLATFVKSDGSPSNYARFMENTFAANLARGSPRKLITSYIEGIPMVHRQVLNRRYIQNIINSTDEGRFTIVDDFKFEDVPIPDCVTTKIPAIVRASSHKLNPFDTPADAPPAVTTRKLVGFNKSFNDENLNAKVAVARYVFDVLGLTLDSDIQKIGSKYNSDRDGTLSMIKRELDKYDNEIKHSAFLKDQVVKDPIIRTAPTYFSPNALLQPTFAGTPFSTTLDPNISAEVNYWIVNGGLPTIKSSTDYHTKQVILAVNQHRAIQKTDELNAAKKIDLFGFSPRSEQPVINSVGDSKLISDAIREQVIADEIKRVDKDSQSSSVSSNVSQYNEFDYPN